MGSGSAADRQWRQAKANKKATLSGGFLVSAAGFCLLCKSDTISWSG